jgi:formylglycine-generating enzyme required for sulfatase activity
MNGLSFSLISVLILYSGVVKLESPDRNCFLKYGGIEKGTELQKTTNGKPNSYGLASTVGNVQEWAYDNNLLVAAGGSRQTPMNDCRVTTVTAHSGQADEFTGFRLVRELQR